MLFNATSNVQYLFGSPSTVLVGFPQGWIMDVPVCRRLCVHSGAMDYDLRRKIGREAR